MLTDIDLNECEIDLNIKCEINLNESEIDLNESENSVKYGISGLNWKDWKNAVTLNFFTDNLRNIDPLIVMTHYIDVEYLDLPQVTDHFCVANVVQR